MAEHTYEIRPCNPETTTNLLWVGGTHGVGLTQRNCFELLKDGIIAWQAAIEWESSCSPFQSQLVWKEANAAVFGAHGEAYALDLHTGAVLFHQTLGSYFSSFEIEPCHRLLLVLTGEEILAFSEQLEPVNSRFGCRRRHMSGNWRDFNSGRRNGSARRLAASND